MNSPKKHFKETERLLRKIKVSKISRWLLEEGYYPEQYVIPPVFHVEKFDLKKQAFYQVKKTKTDEKFEPIKSDLVNVSFPKTQLTDKTFGIIEPTIYHDIVWYLVREWGLIIDHLFHKEIDIYSYSFPIPITKKSEGELSTLRSGRMIYEFIEMAENDLVGSSYNYKYILKTDVKNFYPSVYTHSIAWALHTKEIIRKKGNRNKFSKYLGLKLDKLFQYANDGCTNGIPIGPAVSDLIAEILLSAIDRECSLKLKKNGTSFLGVRYKDDYRFLCQSKEDAEFIIRTLQSIMKNYNLNLNDSKSSVLNLPEGLYRNWATDYKKHTLKYQSKIKYSAFEFALLNALRIDQQFPDTGVIDRFLSDLTSKKNRIKLTLKEKNIMKTFSLLILLKGRRTKSFPTVLGMTEQILNEFNSDKDIAKEIAIALECILTAKLKSENESQYDIIWLLYFIKSLNLTPLKPLKSKSPLINSIDTNSLTFFKSKPTEIKIFRTLKMTKQAGSLLEHLAIFRDTKGSSE